MIILSMEVQLNKDMVVEDDFYQFLSRTHSCLALIQWSSFGFPF